MNRFRMPIPLPPDPKPTAVMIEAEKTMSEFDDYLSYVILSRVKLMASFNREKKNAVLLKCKDAVATLVDKRLIECICSNDPLHGHNLRTKRIVYVKEDTVQSRVRALVESAYPKAHREFIRKKTRGCMATIEHATSLLPRF